MFFPVFIDLADKEILIVGGGKVAARRAAALLPFGCRILVVAARIGEELERILREGNANLRAEERPFERADLDEKYIVLAATDGRNLNHQIAVWCREMGIPVNTADCKEECDFYFPGIARQGEVVAGICAGGTDHRLAKEMTQRVRSVLHE